MLGVGNGFGDEVFQEDCHFLCLGHGDSRDFFCQGFNLFERSVNGLVNGKSFDFFSIGESSTAAYNADEFVIYEDRSADLEQSCVTLFDDGFFDFWAS